MQELLEQVVEIAKGAGEILVEKFSLEHDIYVKENDLVMRGSDFATEADLASEIYILEALRELRPHDLFISEESLTNDEIEEEGEFVWFIDPLDGTKNYSRGDYNFSVLIAAQDRITGEPVIGVVYAPMLHKTWFSSAELGASFVKDRVGLHELPRRTPTENGFTLAYSFSKSKKLENQFNRLSETFASFRSYGSCAIEMCFVAEGIFDGKLANLVYSWDFLAAELIVKNAGMHVYADANTNTPGFTIAVAQSEELLDEILLNL
jgi:myo-inositol-1(or 4)-monophosphatase